MILLNPPGSFPGVIPNYFFRKTPKGGPAGRPSAFFWNRSAGGWRRFQVQRNLGVLTPMEKHQLSLAA